MEDSCAGGCLQIAVAFLAIALIITFSPYLLYFGAIILYAVAGIVAIVGTTGVVIGLAITLILILFSPVE